MPIVTFRPTPRCANVNTCSLEMVDTIGLGLAFVDDFACSETDYGDLLPGDIVELSSVTFDRYSYV